MLEHIKAGRNDLFQSFYKQNQTDFISWAMHYGNCQQEDAEDIYQDAMLIFYNNIRRGKLNKDNLTCSLKTYLCGIAKNLFLKNRDQKAKYELVDNFQDSYFKDHDNTLNSYINQIHQSTICDMAMNQLSGKERTILVRFYYDRFCIGAIREELGYRTENVVRVKKQKSMTKLRKIMNEQFPGEFNYSVAV